MILTDTLASHIEFNTMKTLKADYFMENAAVFKPSPLQRIKCFFLTDICWGPTLCQSALLDGKDTMVSKKNIILALCIQVQETKQI